MSQPQPSNPAKLFDAMAAAYERWAEPGSAKLAKVALYRTGMAPGARVLDVGAGTGALALQAAALGAKVTAVDISPVMVDRLRTRLSPFPDSEARAMDGQQLDFPDGEFDAVFSILGATLFPDQSRALDEAVRVLHPGGRLALVHWATPKGADIFAILSSALQQLPNICYACSAPSITGLLAAADLHASLAARGCVDIAIELLPAPSRLPPPDQFLDELHPLFMSLPVYRNLSEAERAELRPLAAKVVRRWVDVDYDDRIAKVHLATARRGG